MNSTYEWAFITSLLFTLGVEVPCLLICVRLFLKKNNTSPGTGLVLWAGLLASVTTLPYVWFILPAFIRNHLFYIITAEFFAFSLEAVIYHLLFRLPLRQTMVFSLICNSISFLGGELLKKITF